MGGLVAPADVQNVLNLIRYYNDFGLILTNHAKYGK